MIRFDQNENDFNTSAAMLFGLLKPSWTRMWWVHGIAVDILRWMAYVACETKAYTQYHYLKVRYVFKIS